MPAKIWSLGHLSQDQEQLLKEAETTMGGKVLLAYQPAPVAPTDLSQDQLEQIHDLEQKLGMAVVAVERA